MKILKMSKTNVLLIGMMMLTILFCLGSQVQAAQEGDFTYTVTDGKAQVTGYTGAGGNVAVPETLGGASVTSIGYRAFNLCNSLTSITLPESVVSINDEAFSYCENLASISLPDGLTGIGSSAFSFCKALTSITIPDSATAINSNQNETIQVSGPDSGIFQGCISLKSVVLGNGITMISPYMFSQCIKLETVTIKGKVATVEAGAFYRCDSLKSITFPEGLVKIDGEAFQNSGLTSINLPESLTDIGPAAFFSCLKLTSIVIPQNVTDLGYEAFRDCSGLASIQFNSATTKIADNEAKTGGVAIPAAAIIIGYDPSTAKDFATKYNRTFQQLSDMDKKITYRTHVENEGWQAWKYDGVMSGTSNKGLRLEGIQIKINGLENVGVSYSTHVENIGWQDPRKDGVMSGTSGDGLRLEAIKINLTGTDALKYDVYYQVHAQNFGWLDWAKNGENAGTAGFGNRLEAIKIVVVPKGEPAPGATTRPYVEK